jgi:hypothetical protein
VVLKIGVGTETYSSLQKLAVDPSMNEGSAVQTAIERGMERYWSHWFDITATEYERLKKRYIQCQRDNELLRGPVDQNEELR